MNLQPEDFWSFSEWLLRPESFLESAMLQGVALFVLVIILGVIFGYFFSSFRHGPSEGFYAMARAIRDLVRTDLPGTSISRIFALGRLAFKEGIRRKVLFVVALFVAILLLAGWFLNPESDDPARLYISFVLTTTNYLILVLALFISAFSLPMDIKSRTIYTIVTKPVRATEIVLGRILGFVAVGTMILVPMGLLSYVFVTRGLRHTHVEPADIRLDPRGRLVGETDFVQGHQHSFTIEPGETQGLTDVQRGHRHVVTKVDENTFTIGRPTGSLRARVPSYGSVYFLDRKGYPKDEGLNVGQEQVRKGYGAGGVSRLLGVKKGAQRIEHGYVEGGTLGAAIFTFQNVTPERYPDGIPLDLSVRAYRSYKGVISEGIRGSIVIRTPLEERVVETKSRNLNIAQSNPIAFVVDEYEVDEKTLPSKVEGVDENGETRVLDLFTDLVNEKGELQIVITCMDRAQYLGVTKAGVYLRPAENSFEWNITKAYISIWLQMTMVVAFGVMFSTFLSGPVAMVATSVCVLLGFFAEQIHDTRHYIDSRISHGGGPIESLIRLLQQDAMTTELDVEGVAGRVVKTVDAVIVYMMDALATALPNLPKMVETAEYAASGFDIFGALLGRHAVATLGYCILAFVTSYFFLKSREIAA